MSTYAYRLGPSVCSNRILADTWLQLGRIALGIDDMKVIAGLPDVDRGIPVYLHIARHDWRHSRPMDLSDERLLSSLEDRVEGSAAPLGLPSWRRKRRKDA